ncbi:hypothetical protein AB205_0020220, partial [Aquarana catesbeiana]
MEPTQGRNYRQQAPIEHFPSENPTVVRGIRVCICMDWISWTLGFLEGVLCCLHILFHPPIKFSCTNTLKLETAILGIGSVVGLVPPAMTVGSYIFIISTILKIQKKNGRQKAFSTCSSHLTVISLFYGMVRNVYHFVPTNRAFFW